MKIVLIIIYSLYLSFFRRWLGGGFKKLSQNRTLQNFINIIITSFFLFLSGRSLLVSVLCGVLLQFLYFCIGHGGAFDIGRAGYPDEETIKRYKRFFWNKWCEFLVPKQYWYGFGYDFLWMLFRYTLPAVLVSIIIRSPYFSFSGIGVALSYAVCWSLFDRGKTNRPTEIAEFLSGFISGLLLLI